MVGLAFTVVGMIIFTHNNHHFRRMLSVSHALTYLATVSHIIVISNQHFLLDETLTEYQFGPFNIWRSDHRLRRKLYIPRTHTHIDIYIYRTIACTLYSVHTACPIIIMLNRKIHNKYCLNGPITNDYVDELKLIHMKTTILFFCECLLI